MSDPNNKQENQVQKRNPEEDVIWLFLEASLNIGIIKMKKDIMCFVYQMIFHIK